MASFSSGLIEILTAGCEIFNLLARAVALTLSSRTPNSKRDFALALPPNTSLVRPCGLVVARSYLSICDLEEKLIILWTSPCWQQVGFETTKVPR
jgi:hypothetical protein